MRVSQVLSIFGGIFGILGGLFAIVVGFIAGVFEAAFGGGSMGNIPNYFLYIGGVIAIFVSIVGIAASFMKNKMIAGGIILICAIIGLICVSVGYVISFPLFLISSIMLFIEARKEKNIIGKVDKEERIDVEEKSRKYQLEMKYCPSCGKEIQENWRVCPYCGNFLAES